MLSNSLKLPYRCHRVGGLGPELEHFSIIQRDKQLHFGSGINTFSDQIFGLRRESS
jgi:hypothetical protein